jgi:hypothetical protein
LQPDSTDEIKFRKPIWPARRHFVNCKTLTPAPVLQSQILKLKQLQASPTASLSVKSTRYKAQGLQHKETVKLHRVTGMLHKEMGLVHKRKGMLHKGTGSEHKRKSKLHRRTGILHKETGYNSKVISTFCQVICK